MYLLSCKVSVHAVFAGAAMYISPVLTVSPYALESLLAAPPLITNC